MPKISGTGDNKKGAYMQNKEETILNFMKDKDYVPMKAKEMALVLNISKDRYNELVVVLNKLESECKIIKNRKNRYRLNDDDVLELGGVIDYPKFFLTSAKSVSKKIETSPLVHKAILKKEFGFVFRIIIEEKRPLFFDESSKNYVFDDGGKLSENQNNMNFRVPRLLNYVPDKKYSKFIENMGKVNLDTLSKIGDIEYQPNDFDKDRFLLYMDDGNMVYLTLTKFKTLNHYNEVIPQLEGHKGILYLDNGNHFEIKE